MSIPLPPLIPAIRRLARLAIVVFAVFVVPDQQLLSAGLKGDPEPLKPAAHQHQANRERIVTWRGRANVEQVLLGGEPLRSEVYFVYDAPSGNYRWNWTVKEVPEGSWKRYTEGEQLNGMVKDGKYYEYRTHRRRSAKGKNLPSLVIQPPSEQANHQNLPGFFDPMWHYTHPGKGPFENELLFVYENAQNPKINYETSQNDDLLILRTVSDESGPNEVVNHYEMDHAQGANLTLAHYYSAQSGITTDYRFTWEEVSGVWVPKTFTYHSFEMKEGKKVYEHIRKVTWTENIVNERVPEDAFTQEKVGLGPGDFVTDTHTKQFYRMKGGPPERERKNLTMGLLIINAILLAFGAVWLSVRRFRRREKAEA